MIRIHDIHKWATLEPGEALRLVGDGNRQVRIEVNCPKPTRFDVVEAGEVIFIATVQGLETLEFTVGDKVDEDGLPPVLVPYQDSKSPSAIWYFTNKPETEESDMISFTRIDPRPARNRELELLMYKQRINSERRIQAQQRELDTIKATLAGLQVNAETGEVDEGVDPGTSSQGATEPQGASATSGQSEVETDTA